jgi:hypothetical protein
MDMATRYDIAGKLQNISKVLKRLGYANQNHVKLYGNEYWLVNDPVAMTETLVVVDAIETKSGRNTRLRIPLNVVNMAHAQIAA